MTAARGTGRRGGASGPVADPSVEALVGLGLRKGSRLRWRRAASERWQEGIAERVEKDGSVGLRDGKGRARAIPVALVEVRGAGPRGGTTWTPLTEIATQDEQLTLL